MSTQFMVEEIAPLAIVFAHVAQVAGKVPLMQKVGQGHLLQNRNVDIDKAPSSQQRFDQFGRSNDIAQAQGWEKYFAKGTDIEHPSGRVQSLESLQRTPA